MWKCPGCDQDYGSWGDKAPCVIPECDHIMCRDCCENRGKCATCSHEIWSPPCDCVCGAVKYFQPDHNALRLLDEAKEMKKLLAQPLSVKAVTGRMRTNVYVGKGVSDAQSLTVFVKTLMGETLEFKELFSCDTVDRLKLMIQNCEGYAPDEQRLLFDGLQLDEGGRTLAQCKIGDGSTLHLILRLRGC